MTEQVSSSSLVEGAMKVVIIGAGGHGQVVADILLAGLKGSSLMVQPIGFVDDDLRLKQQVFLGLPVLGTLAQLSAIRYEGVIVAIGNNRVRQKIYRRLQGQGRQFASAYHPSAIVGTGVEVGSGAMISAGVIINTGSRIGEDVILNTACTVDHHNQIGDHVHIAPGVHLGGEVEIDEGVLVGIGATVMPQRRIGAWSVIGAGAVVTKDVPAYSTVTGVPARVVKVNEAIFEA
jgi:sugar O-acyltransferase (sialic acid O-acetyltransferase NeuD family)